MAIVINKKYWERLCHINKAVLNVVENVLIIGFLEDRSRA